MFSRLSDAGDDVKNQNNAAFNNKVNSRHVIRIDDTAIGDDAQV